MPPTPPHDMAHLRRNDALKLVTEISPSQNPWQEQAAIEPLSYDLVNDFVVTLAGKSEATQQVYARILRQFTHWIAVRPGGENGFDAALVTASALSIYLAELEGQGYSWSHRSRVKAVVNRFARWLVEQRGVLWRNPVPEVTLPARQQLAPRELSPDQRYVLRNLVERQSSPRSAAIFALGYWAGCRVSDVSWLEVDAAHVGPKLGWVEVGYKGGKKRQIDLVNEARRALFDYLKHDSRSQSRYVFTSQRGERLTEAGIHHWLRALKLQATKREWDLIGDVTFHDLRHDFAHRARAAGWSLEEIAYYLGHVTARGTPAIQTTVRYTQVSRDQVKSKLRLLAG